MVSRRTSKDVSPGMSRDDRDQSVFVMHQRHASAQIALIGTYKPATSPIKGAWCIER
jgi:hypothetical protein